MAFPSYAAGSARRFERGAGLIETLVGILIGLVVALVIYNVLVQAEGFRRNTLGVSDAQVTGQMSQFVLGRELSNGGNGVMAGLDELARCDDWRMRPLPALITDGGGPLVSDAVTIFYSNAPRIVHPVRVSGLAVSPAPYPVESPNGFAINDWVIATDRGTNCTLGLVTGITQHPSGNPYPPADVGGRVALAYTWQWGPAFNYDVGSRVVNLGQRMTRIAFSHDVAKAQLRSTDDMIPMALAPQPLAANVVLMKAQYGIDTDANTTVDCWQPADASNACGVGDLSEAAFKALPAPANLAQTIRRIKAVRIAVVVRSEDVAKPDTISSLDAASIKLTGQSAVLFNCAANDLTCQGRNPIDNTIMQDYGRYRIYEATIPLRNALWSAP